MWGFMPQPLDNIKEIVFYHSLLGLSIFSPNRDQQQNWQEDQWLSGKVVFEANTEYAEQQQQS